MANVRTHGRTYVHALRHLHIFNGRWKMRENKFEAEA